MRQMPGGQWVAFDVSTDAPHEHNKSAKLKKSIPLSSIKSKNKLGSIKHKKEPAQENSIYRNRGSAAKTTNKQSSTTEKTNFNGWFWIIFIIVFYFFFFS